MKRSLATIGLGALAAVGLAAGLASGATQTPWVVSGSTGRGHTPVTICHKPGAPAEKTLVVDDDAVPGHLGHGDYVGTCNAPPPVDVCPNISGDQPTVPPVKIQDEHGNCVDPPPVDVCPNLDGSQTGVPSGYELVDGRCVEIVTPPPADRCPPGMTPTAGKDGKAGNDECEYPTTTTTDTTPTTMTDTTPTATTDTTPTITTPATTPAAPFTPPTTTAKKPVVEKPAVKTAPTTPKKAVAGAFAQEPPKLAYTP